MTRFLFFCFLSLLPFLGQAQHRPLKVESLMPRNGLPHPNVLSLHQDQRGFLWFGTEDGLGFYDGYNILPILKSKRYELINNHITCIA